MRSFKLGALRVVGRNLLVSGRGERERMKRQHNILASTIIAQPDVEPLHIWFGDDAGQNKVRRGIADFE
jgi:hypothetical protein